MMLRVSMLLLRDCSYTLPARVLAVRVSMLLLRDCPQFLVKAARPTEKFVQGSRPLMRGF